jgi:integrase
MMEKKTGKDRQVSISVDLLRDFERFVAWDGLVPSHFLFYSSFHAKVKPMTRQWVHKVISRVSRENGLNFIGTHSMRKIYACNLFSRFSCVYEVQKAMNHKYPSTTLIYLADLLAPVSE